MKDIKLRGKIRYNNNGYLYTIKQIRQFNDVYQVKCQSTIVSPLLLHKRTKKMCPTPVTLIFLSNVYLRINYNEHIYEVSLHNEISNLVLFFRKLQGILIFAKGHIFVA